MNLKCDHSFCGYEIEWSTARKPENSDMLGDHGCPECGGTLRPMLTEAMRLTMLSHFLRCTAVPYGESFVTTWDRWVDMRIPVRELLADVAPLSSPPYSEEEFEVMFAVMTGRIPG